jgi:thioredoxin reductase (NADPH)
MNVSGPEIRETPDHYGAYPRLSAEQIEALSSRGRSRVTQAGDVLFHEGDPSYDMHVIRAGTVALIEGYGTADERVIGVHGPGRFLGEFNLLAGQPAFLTAVTGEPGQTLTVPVDEVRALVADDLTLGDLILRAFLIRRFLLIELGAGMRIIGSRYSPQCRRIRDFAARNRLPYSWLDLEEDKTAETLLRQLGIPPQDTPVVIWQGRQVLRDPSNAELARVAGLVQPSLADTDYDMVIIGAGPAGLTASVYAASEGLKVAVLEAVATGGQAGTSSRIENYLGFPSGISGAELAERAVLQARKFGAGISVPASAVRLDVRDGDHQIGLGDGTEISCRAVLIATGARYRRLEVPGLAQVEKTSVYYAATTAELHACRGVSVAVVGGGNSAGQAATFLAAHAAHVHLLVREPELDSKMSRYLADRISRLPNITVHTCAEIIEVSGRDALEELVYADQRTRQQHHLGVAALFVLIGAAPATEWLAGGLALDGQGFILTGPDLTTDTKTGAAADFDPTAPRRRPYLLETSRAGVFAAGDVRSGSIKRVAAAVGEGAMAVQLVHMRLNQLVY